MRGVFGHGALRLYLLSLLAEAPRHGYELMRALEHRFGGTYSPSAGTIYPRLSKLEEEGLVTKTTDGRRTTYEITDEGRAELRVREGELRTLEGEITDSVRRMASDVREGVKSAMQTLRAELAAAERDARSSARRPSSASSSPSSGLPAQEGSSAPDHVAHEWHDASGTLGDDGTRSSHVWTEASDAHERVAARMAIHDVDLALNDFRQQVRQAVRRDRGEHLTSAEAALVRSELEAALLRITSVL